MIIETKKLSEFVYEYRMKYQLTQIELSQFSGVPIRIIVEAEKGIFTPTSSAKFHELIHYIAPNERIVEVFSDGEIFIEKEILAEDLEGSLPILRGLLHYHERMMLNASKECNGLTDVYAQALRTAIACVQEAQMKGETNVKDNM